MSAAKDKMIAHLEEEIKYLREQNNALVEKLNTSASTNHALTREEALALQNAETVLPGPMQDLWNAFMDIETMDDLTADMPQEETGATQ